LLQTPGPESWNRSLRKPRPPIAHERQRPLREITLIEDSTSPQSPARFENEAVVPLAPPP
jgi:hypothetical protein